MQRAEVIGSPPPSPLGAAVPRKASPEPPSAPLTVSRSSARAARPVLGQPVRSVTPPAPATVVDRQAGVEAVVGTSPNGVVDRSPADVVIVRRSVEVSDVETAPITDSTDAEPGASSTEVAEVAAPGGGESRSPKEMADELYPHIERRLRMSLLLERERKGALSDALWSAGGR